MKQSSVSIAVDGVTLCFGGISALDEVSFEVYSREILAIIGPNGAGKTSLLNCMNGFYRPQKGRIIFAGHDLTRSSPHEIAKLGLARTFQNIELYTGMSTLDNLMAARHVFMKYGLLSASIYFGRAHRHEIRHRRIVEEIIDFLELQAIRKTPVGTLPYGQRKRVELGRALALEPKVLLLDEPMAGMNVEEKEDMARFILDIYELKKIPIVIIEHDMGLVMDIADRIVVLDFGKKIAEGKPAEIQSDPRVIQAYLGSKSSQQAG